MSKTFGIGWDYEETEPPYYHIYSYNYPADGIVNSLTIEVPLTDRNTENVEMIVQLIRQILERTFGDD